MKIERYWAMPHKNTFKIDPINQLIQEELTEGLWLNPFANSTKLYQDKTRIIYNDLNPNYDCDYHLDALDFLKLYEDNSIDGVLYDPPFSPRQLKECYDDIGISLSFTDTQASFWSNIKKEIARVVKTNGKVISCGWNSNGIGQTNGFEMQRILIVPHGGMHNDTIVTVEVKKQLSMNNLF